jgi:hypothetical protein
MAGTDEFIRPVAEVQRRIAAAVNANLAAKAKSECVEIARKLEQDSAKVGVTGPELLLQLLYYWRNHEHVEDDEYSMIILVNLVHVEPIGVVRTIAPLLNTQDKDTLEILDGGMSLATVLPNHKTDLGACERVLQEQKPVTPDGLIRYMFRCNSHDAILALARVYGNGVSETELAEKLKVNEVDSRLYFSRRPEWWAHLYAAWISEDLARRLYLSDMEFVERLSRDPDPLVQEDVARIKPWTDRLYRNVTHIARKLDVGGAEARRGFEEGLVKFVDDFPDGRIEFGLYERVMRDRKDDVPLGLVRYLFKRDAPRALLSTARVYGVAVSEKELSDRLAGDVGQSLRYFCARPEWWAHLYAAQQMLREAPLRDPALMEQMERDPHPLVQERLALIKVSAATDHFARPDTAIQERIARAEGESRTRETPFDVIISRLEDDARAMGFQGTRFFEQVIYYLWPRYGVNDLRRQVFFGRRMLSSLQVDPKEMEKVLRSYMDTQDPDTKAFLQEALVSLPRREPKR